MAAQGSSEQRAGSLLQDALRNITRLVSRRPKITLWIVVVLACTAVGWTVTSIGFKTDRADLIDPDADFHQRWMDYTESFGDGSDLIVVVESDQPDRIPPVLEELGRRMEQEPRFFRSVLYKVERGRMPAHKGLQYLPPQQLQQGLQNLQAMRPLLEADGRSLTLDAVVSRWSAELDARRRSGSSQEVDDLLRRAVRFTGSLSAFLESPGRFQSPWGEIVPGSSDLHRLRRPTTYFRNEAGTMGFVEAIPTTQPHRFETATHSIDRLRELIQEVQARHPEVTIGVTGIPVLENDEMRRSRFDMSRAAIISFLGVGLLLALGFRGLRHPLLALAMLAVGMAWSFGYTTVVVGHLNILSISFAVILIGLGIDFAIHYLARYLEHRHEGDDLRPALAKTSAGVGVGIVTAAVTTALAFFSATFTQFLGVAELGIIAGGGILLCAAATFLVLPALVSLSDRHIEPKKLPTPFQASLLRRLTSKLPRPATFLSVVLIAGLGSQVFEYRDGGLRLRVRYDYNLLNLQAVGLESVETQQRVFQQADHSLLYAVSIADSPAQARRLKQQLTALPTVDHVEELATALPAAPYDQTGPLIESYRSALSEVSRFTNRESVPRPPPRQPAVVGRALEQFYLRVRQLRGADAAKTASTIDRFLDRFEQLSLQQQRAFINDFQQRSAAALYEQMSGIAAAAHPEPVTVDDLPESLASRFISPRGEWLLQIYPKDQVWDNEPLQRFVTDVRSVDPQVTGTPLQNLEASRQIKASYKRAAIYAFAVICLVLLVDFLDRDYTLLTLLSPLAVIVFSVMVMKTRRVNIDPVVLVVTYTVMASAIAAVFDFRNLRDAVLAMLPAIAGGLMLFGALGILGMNLNPANLIALPLVLGIGVDDGVHIVHDFRSQTHRYRTSPSTMNAIVLTSLTSMIGFGSMMVAAHRGLYSVGLVLVIGVGGCLFVSVVTLPAILTLVSTAGETTAEATERARGTSLDHSGQAPAQARHHAA